MSQCKRVFCGPTTTRFPTLRPKLPEDSVIGRDCNHALTHMIIFSPEVPHFPFLFEILSDNHLPFTLSKVKCLWGSGLPEYFYVNAHFWGSK